MHVFDGANRRSISEIADTRMKLLTVRLLRPMVWVLPNDYYLDPAQGSEVGPRVDVFGYDVERECKKGLVRFNNQRRGRKSGFLRGGYILRGVGVSFGPLSPSSHNHCFSVIK